MKKSAREKITKLAALFAASDIIVQIGMPPFAEFNAAAYEILGEAITPEDIELFKKREMTEARKLEIRQSVLAAAEALREELTGKAAQLSLFQEKCDALASEQVEQPETGDMSEAEKVVRSRIVEAAMACIGNKEGGPLDRLLRSHSTSYPGRIKGSIPRWFPNNMVATEKGLANYRRAVTELIKGLQELTGSEEKVRHFKQAAVFYVDRWMNFFELPVLRAGSGNRRGGVKGHNTTYGTPQEQRRNWAHWQKVVNRLHKEHPSWNLNTVYFVASKEVRQVNGKPVRPDTIRHHVKNPKKRVR